MNLRSLIAALLLTAASVLTVSAQGNGRSVRLTPKWLKEGTRMLNGGNVAIIPIQMPSMPRSTSELDAMYSRIETALPKGVRLIKSGQRTDNHNLEESNEGFGGKATSKGETSVYFDNDEVYFTPLPITQGYYKDTYAMLFQAVPAGHSMLDYRVTDSYGAAGCLLSVIPGCGQFYKGDPIKGVLFLGGCALGAGASAFTLMQRQAYISQMGQTHDVNVIKQLDAKQKNMGIVGGICLGATAIIYLWNLVDGALAPGAERLVLTGNGLNFKF